MVKVTGFCISAAIALLAGSAAAQSPKPSATPHPNIGLGPHGQPCIPAPLSANKVLSNVAPAAMKSHPITVNPADDEGDKKATVEPTDPPSSVGNGGGDPGESGDVDDRLLPTPRPTGHHPTSTTKPPPNFTQQGTQTTSPAAGTQQCSNMH